MCVSVHDPAGTDGIRGVRPAPDADESRHDVPAPGLRLSEHLVLQVRH